WSPAGIAFASSRLGTFDIWVVAPDGTGARQATTGPGREGEPSWSPGGRIAYVSDGDLVTIASDGTAAVPVTADDVADGSPAWSPDGRRIVFTRAGSLAIVPAAGGGVRTFGPGEQPSW